MVKSKGSSPVQGTLAAAESAPKMGRKIGYARVSTHDQNTDLQHDALKAAACDFVFEDKVSGTTDAREGLDAALAIIGAGDRLVVWRLDRLGRSIPHVMTIVAELSARGASLISLSEGFDTGCEAGELYSTILAMIAHVERRMIVARTRAGLDAAKQRGIKLGAPRKLSNRQCVTAARMAAKGRKINEIAFELGVSRSTLYRRMKSKPSHVNRIAA
jgi:DNA invertase Pin-like site-specific DNA recombinase